MRVCALFHFLIEKSMVLGFAFITPSLCELLYVLWYLCACVCVIVWHVVASVCLTECQNGTVGRGLDWKSQGRRFESRLGQIEKHLWRAYTPKSFGPRIKHEAMCTTIIDNIVGMLKNHLHSPLQCYGWLLPSALCVVQYIYAGPKQPC